ncbi:hypothetical protein GPALN_012036 [Globodera pallida]|nr:hypothetical protein GPALN_012036 [Globodera pallida]
MSGHNSRDYLSRRPLGGVASTCPAALAVLDSLTYTQIAPPGILHKAYRILFQIAAAAHPRRVAPENERQTNVIKSCRFALSGGGGDAGNYTASRRQRPRTSTAGMTKTTKGHIGCRCWQRNGQLSNVWLWLAVTPEIYARQPLSSGCKCVGGAALCVMVDVRVLSSCVCVVCSVLFKHCILLPAVVCRCPGNPVLICRGRMSHFVFRDEMSVLGAMSSFIFIDKLPCFCFRGEMWRNRSTVRPQMGDSDN